MPAQHQSISYGFATLLILPLICCSCSIALVKTLPTRTGAALRPGAGRQELIACLGQPQSSGAQPISPTAMVLRTNEQATVCDVYAVSKLVQIHGDPYATDWNVYPTFVIITLGVPEVVTFPYVLVDMTARSLQKRELLAWYGASDQLIAYERRKLGKSD